MLKPIRRLITGTPLVAVPAVAADPGVQTGITSVGPAMFLFTVASALFLMLVFRSAANSALTWVTSRIGRIRIRQALARRSGDVLHDFIIPGAHGGLAKIDHAILAAGGILCIESKHCNGIVLGAADDPQWTIVDGVQRQRFLNPLIRNEGRTRALRRIVPGVPVDNLVVFTGATEFPSPPPPNVIRVDQLEGYLAGHAFGPSGIEDWDAVWLGVRSAILHDEAARKDFDAQISFG